MYWNKQELHCLGDSHTSVFEWVASKRIWIRTNFHFKIIQGATAFGLANPNSKTNAFEILTEYINTLSNVNHLLLSMGEVDCGFLIWYRSQKYGFSIDDQFETSLSHYFNFISKINGTKNFKRIIIYSVPLPTIYENQSWGEVANLRREVKIPIKERTDLTLEYNSRLNKFCQSAGYIFFNIEDVLLNPVSGLLKGYYRNPNPLDHHLNNEKIGPIVGHKLNSLGYW